MLKIPANENASTTSVLGRAPICVHVAVMNLAAFSRGRMPQPRFLSKIL